MDKLFEKILSDRFVEIMKAHGNPLWALETLEYEVFVKNIEALERLEMNDQWIIRNFMDALRRIYGGN